MALGNFVTGINRTTTLSLTRHGPSVGVAHLGREAVSKGNGQGGRMVADRKGIGADDGA